MPVPSQNKYGGIFQYVLKMDGTDAEVRQAQAQLSKLTPETAAVYQALNILPEGEIKSWLMANPVQFWKKVYELVFGRKYTTGDYVLGERMSDQIYCSPDIGRRQVSDDMVRQAHTLFNQLFGVRIATTEDLDALDFGVAGYKNRVASNGIGNEAIERAVYLKQNYYPISTYNRNCWDLSWFEKYPLVDRIPDYVPGKWYTGPVIGGANAVDGLIPVSAASILRQYPGATFDQDTGETVTPGGQVVSPTSNTSNTTLQNLISYVKSNPIFLALGLGLIVYSVDEQDIDDLL